MKQARIKFKSCQQYFQSHDYSQSQENLLMLTNQRVESSRSGKTVGTLFPELHCFDVLTQVLSMTFHDPAKPRSNHTLFLAKIYIMLHYQEEHNGKFFKIINKQHILFINLVKIFKDLPSSTVKPLFVCCIRCSLQSNSLNTELVFNLGIFSPNQPGWGRTVLFSGKSRSRFYGWRESRALKLKQTVVKNYLWQIL